MEYQKHVERNGPNFFSIHHGEKVDGSVLSQGVLDEGDYNSYESYNEDETKLHTTYEQEEVLGYNVDEDIRLSGQVDDDSQNNELSTLFDDIICSDDPDEISYEDMVGYSLLLNPLFEDDCLCNGMH